MKSNPSLEQIDWIFLYSLENKGFLKKFGVFEGTREGFLEKGY